MWINTILLGNYPPHFLPTEILQIKGCRPSPLSYNFWRISNNLRNLRRNNGFSDIQYRRYKRALARFGVKFGIYKNGEFHEQLFPYDSLPRIILRMSSLKLKPAWFSVSMRSTPSWETSTRKSELSLTAWFRKTSLFRQAASCRRVTTLFRRTELLSYFRHWPRPS